jgi:hypothetical protein
MSKQLGLLVLSIITLSFAALCFLYGSTSFFIEGGNVLGIVLCCLSLGYALASGLIFSEILSIRPSWWSALRCTIFASILGVSVSLPLALIMMWSPEEMIWATLISFVSGALPIQVYLSITSPQKNKV